MQHTDAGHKTLPLNDSHAVYHGAKSPYPFRFAGWMSLTITALARQHATARAWPNITVVPDNEIMQHRRIAMLELGTKSIYVSAT